MRQILKAIYHGAGVFLKTLLDLIYPRRYPGDRW